MASEKAAQILRVRSDFSKEEIEQMSEADAWTYIYSLDKQERREKSSQLEICFTGLSLAERAALETKAQAHGFVVKSSVTKSLKFLCAGLSAGPSKLSKARSQGVVVLTPQDFVQLCDSGELPQE